MPDDDRRGYKHPPLHGRFKPGVSGNPSGRPRRKPTIADFVRNLLDRPATVMDNGRRITVSGREAIARNYHESALKGQLQAMKEVSAIDREGHDQLEGEENAVAEDVEIVETFAEQSAGTLSGDSAPEPFALLPPPKIDGGGE